VQKSGDALQYVPEALKTEALCIEAMKHSNVHITILYRGGMGMQTPPPPTHPLQQVPEKLRTEAVCLAAVLNDDHARDFMPDALKTEAFEAKIRSIRSENSSGSGGSGYGINLIKPI